MKTVATILGLVAAAFGLTGAYFDARGKHDLGFKFYVFALFFTVAAVLFYAIDHLRRDSYKPLSLFKKAARNNRPPRNPVKSSAQHPDNPKLRQAIFRLIALSEHLPKDDLSETYVNDYHAQLDLIGAELRQDLTAFRIPQSELRRHVVGLGWEGAHDGWQVTESKEQFCPPEAFRIALSGALKFIESCPPPQTEQQIPSAKKPKELEVQAATSESPSLLTTSATSGTDAYRPDETAIEILKEISKGNGYESQITNVLKLTPAQARTSLASLEERHYIKLQSLENRASYYQLTNKGRDELNKPARTVPHPIAWPDALAIAVMVHIARAEYPDPARVLSKELNLDPIVIEHCLDKLLAHHYVDEDWLAPLRSQSRYRLSATGREFIVTHHINIHTHQLTPVDKTKLPQAIESLEAFKQRLPEGDIEESLVAAFNGVLKDIQDETKLYVSRYFIPDALMEPELIAPRQPRIGNRRGAEPAYSKKRYCDRDMFLTTIDGLIDFINQKLSNG